MTAHVSDDPEKRARQLANLRPFPKGENGNANGIRGPLITPLIRKYLAMDPADFWRLKFKTVAEIVAAGYVFEAMQSGYDRGRTEVIERADGKVKETHELEVTRKVEKVILEQREPPLRLIK